MNGKLKLVLIILSFALVLTAIGCQNWAAERLAEDCWEFRTPLLLANTNFTDNERELFLIEVMQAKGFDDEKIADEIENLRKLRSEEE